MSKKRQEDASKADTAASSVGNSISSPLSKSKGDGEIVSLTPRSESQSLQLESTSEKEKDNVDSDEAGDANAPKEQLIDMSELKTTRQASSYRIRKDGSEKEFKVKVLDPQHSVYVTAKQRMDHYTQFPHHMHPKSLEFKSMRAKNRATKSKEFSTPSCYFPRRFIMIILMFFVATLNYTMRTLLSVAIVPIGDENGWDDETKGLVLAAFYWGYVLTQIPGGILTAKFGAKYVVLIGVTLSAVFTVIFPFTVKSVPFAILSRVAFGIVQAPCHPSFTQTISYWFPHSEKNIMSALIATAYTLGQVFALGLTGPIHSSIGWPYAFYIWGGLVGVWLIFWIAFFINKPHEKGFCLPIDTHELAKILQLRANKTKKSSIQPERTTMDTGTEEGEAETDASASADVAAASIEDAVMDVSKKGREVKERVPWGAISTTPSFLALAIAFFSYTWSTYVFVSWLPTYLKTVYHFNLDNSGIFSLLPYLIKGIVAVVAGIVARKLANRTKRLTFLRKIFASLALFIPVVCFVILSFVKVGPTWAVILFCIALGVSSCQVVGIEGLGYDMSTKYAGVMMAITNTVGTIPGVIGVYLTGYMLESTNNQWWTVFLLAAAISFAGGLVFDIIASSSPVDFDKRKVCGGRSCCRK